MSSNSNEREIARGFGFGTPRQRIPGLAPGGGLGTSLGEALGLRSGASVLLAGPGSAALKTGLAATGARVVSIMPSGVSDCVVYRVESTYSLHRLADVAAKLGRDGFLWVLWPRSAGHITAQHIKRAGTSAGLIAVHHTHVDGHTAGMKFIHARDDW